MLNRMIGEWSSSYACSNCAMASSKWPRLYSVTPLRKILFAAALSPAAMVGEAEMIRAMTPARVAMSAGLRDFGDVTLVSFSVSIEGAIRTADSVPGRQGRLPRNHDAR